MSHEEALIETRCGFVAIVGRPNVGKSTLLNQLFGEKLSITSKKPQTTRHRLLGIKTIDTLQIIYVDTPGIHAKELRALNRYMNRVALQSMRDVDVVLFVVEGLRWTDEDEYVFQRLTHLKCPIILVLNKVDLILDKKNLLPYLKTLAEKYAFFAIIPLSAKRRNVVEKLEKLMLPCLPFSPHYFPESQMTDQSHRFRAAEVVREKVMRAFGAELPYSTTVEIEKFQLKPNTVVVIHALILVEREGQKAILIGERGERLKEIGIRSRMGIEKFLKKQVHLKLWVKVRAGWSDDERALKSLGYFDDASL
jgi:GTP-binding protein Era